MRHDDDSAESGVEAAGRTPKAKLEPIAAMRAEFNKEDVLTSFDGFQLGCAKDVFIGLNVDAEDVGNSMVAGQNTKAKSLCRFLDRVVAVILVVNDDALKMVSVVADEVDVEHSVLL